MVFNCDCRKLSKIKYFFTFLFILRSIFAVVVPKIKPEILACIDVRVSCVTVSDISYSSGESQSAGRRYNALSVLVNFVKVGILQYTPILLVVRAFLHPTGGHFMDDAFRLCSLYYSVHHS